MLMNEHTNAFNDVMISAVSKPFQFQFVSLNLGKVYLCKTTYMILNLKSKS